MSDIPSKTLAKEICKRSLEERRQRQQMYLDKWDAGKITARQCIESITELEKILYIGDQIKILKRSQK